MIVNLPDSGPLLSRTGVDGSKYEKYTQTARSGHRLLMFDMGQQQAADECSLISSI